MIRLWACGMIVFLLGCGPAWHGRVVHLEGGKVVIQPRSHNKIEVGRKLLIYREKSIIHPVTGEMLGNIKDEFAEIPVLRAREHTVTAIAGEREFDMIEVGDEVIAVSGSVEMPAGSVYGVGRIEKLIEGERRAICQIDAASEVSGSEGLLTVIKYTGVVIDPDTSEIVAVSVEPVADLQIDANEQSELTVHYGLMDEKLGWIENGDVVVRRTGGMKAERLWFQDPPEGFSEEWIFVRNYLRAIRHYDSGLYREAILELNDVAQMDPEYKDAPYLLGLCHTNLNRYEEAAAVFEDILKRNPGDARTWAALAYTYMKQGKLREAANSYEKLVGLLPGDSEVWVDLGDLYRTLEDYEKAEEAYRKALEIDGENEAARYELHALDVR